MRPGETVLILDGGLVAVDERLVFSDVEMLTPRLEYSDRLGVSILILDVDGRPARVRFRPGRLDDAVDKERPGETTLIALDDLDDDVLVLRREFIGTLLYDEPLGDTEREDEDAVRRCRVG